MAVRDRLIKMLGGSTMERGIEAAGMVNRPFSPGEPISPMDGYSGTPRSRDYITGVNISSRPRHNEQVAFSTLRGLVDAYDIAQMCIWHRIDSIRSMDWNLVAKKGETGDVAKAMKMGHMVLKKPDREFPFKTWLAKYLYDILAFDAGTLHKMRNVAGRAVALRVLDGTTIAPLLDYWGNRPTGDAPAFVQFAQGLPWEWLNDQDLIYEPFRPVSNSSYGKAPLEAILLNANTDLRFQSYFLGRFTEGNIPEGFAGSPEGWSPDQIAEYQETWDALLYGDDTQKHQIKWVPNGTTFDWTNEATFDDTFSLFLMRKTAAAYHVTPADLGFTETVNKSSGETQADVSNKIGDLPLAQHVQEILSCFLQDDLGLPLNFEFDTGKETKDILAVAQANQIYVNIGAVGVSEIREEVFGLPEPDGIPVPRFIHSERAGPIPLSALYAVAGPVDRETAAPIPGGPLPHKPFALVEGTAPQKPPASPPLAVVAYPADNAESVQAAAVSAQAPVLKAETVGITVATGGNGYPLVSDSDDDDDEDPHLSVEANLEDDAVAKQAEDKVFRTYVKARKRDGRWRDFTFLQSSPRVAQEANRAGRAQVRKAAGMPSVAGLVVRAADSGRVLMLQRALDPTDPAGGKWEFPGGHIEDGESVEHAAIREWCEETGCPPPPAGIITGGWLGSNGIYQGVIVTVPDESCCVINSDAPPHLANPDDPDGDLVETAAWWSPADLANNSAVRAELLTDLSIVLPNITAEAIAKAMSGWEAHPYRKIEDALQSHYAPRIRAGVRALVSDEQIRSAVTAYLDHTR